MIPGIFPKVFYLGCVVLMTVGFLPATHAQQTGNIPGDAWQPHRPDNQPKQKEAISGGACIVQTGAFPVGFNAYVVPDGDHPSFPPFCSPVPAGPLNLVIDILAPDVREAPLAVRLMKIEGGEEREVLSIPAKEYTSGNIPLAVNLEPLGKYNVLLIGNDASGNVNSLVSIPLDVRKAGDFIHTGNGGTGWGFLLLVVGLAGLTGGLLYFWRPKPKPAVTHTHTGGAS
ncbi:hypothetical protein [Nitrosospira sp. Nsp13]|uniref:hypothetical protein n=1 Tax=Nitrosospira sp. Nsp13 TaxID=1855332 RepID=UPI00088F09BF|nr:hypothetical protein [Nitrosospira sp. Nsp13]SCY59179.1 hypothetical protein SAMN05216308_1225 [Nitrosospira sp. Nsp13]